MVELKFPSRSDGNSNQKKEFSKIASLGEKRLNNIISKANELFKRLPNEDRKTAFERALEFLENEFGKESDNFRVNSLFGYAHYGLGNFGKARDYYTRAYELEHSIWGDAGHNLNFYSMRIAVCLFRLDRVEEAGAILHKLNLDPFNDERAFHMYGIIKYKDGDFESAEENFKKALERNPLSYELSYQLSKAQMKLGKYGEALKTLDELIEILESGGHAKKEHSKYYSDRATMHRHLNEFEKARKDYERALELFPDSYYAFKNRGILSFLEDKFENAISDLNMADKHRETLTLEYQNDDSLFYWLAKSHLAVYNFAEAKENIVKALKISPQTYSYRELGDEIMRNIRASQA